jgi:hypothetical protein
VTVLDFVLIIVISIAKTTDQGCKVTIFLTLILSVSSRNNIDLGRFYQSYKVYLHSRKNEGIAFSEVV